MKDIRVHEFWDDDETLTEEINNWLEMNKDVDIISIEYSTSAPGVSGALIIYKKQG